MDLNGATGGRARSLKCARLLARPFNLAVFFIAAAIVAAVSISSAWANHVHMHGGPFIGVVLAVAVDPARPGTVYVVAHGGGVFRSKDRGESWISVNEGLPNRQVFSMLLDSSRPGNLYLGTDQGIYRSTDEGANWRPLSRVLDQRNIRALALDRQDTGLLYAATDQGVFLGSRTVTWQRLTAGLPHNDIRALAIDSKGTVFAGAFGGVYKKSRSETRWQEVSSGLTDKRIRALAADSSSTGFVYAGTATSGVFRTTNEGISWQEHNRGLLNSTVLSLLRVPLADQSLYVGTVDGIFVNRGGKNQWASIGPDLPFTVSAITYDPSQPRRLYAGSGGRLYKSDDAGKNWVEGSRQINYFGSVSRSTKR
jgi:ligand-binding sensor domain-containing protein